MTKTVVIGKKIEGVTQLSRFMVLSGDKIVLLDAKTGLSPKKVTSKVIDKNLYIYEEGATDPSVILNDYKTFENSVQIQGIDQGGTYYDYAMGDSGTMALSSTPVVAPVAAHEPWLSTNAMLGIGILAAGGVALAAGGGGGGGSTPTPPTTTVTSTASLVDSMVQGVSYTTSSGLTGVTLADGSFTYKSGDTVTFKVGNATIGTFNTANINTTDRILTIQELAGVARTNTTDSKVVNIAQFLQSLDSDANAANGITIAPATAASITTVIDVQAVTDVALQAALPVGVTLVTEVAAIAHLDAVAANITSPIALSDTVKPILAITDDEPMVTANMDGSNSDGSTDANGADVLYMFTFTEAVQNFTIDDIVVTMQKTDGTVDVTYTAATDPSGSVFKTFTKVSDNVYTLAVRPEAGYEGVMKVSAATSNATDIVGNVIDATNSSTLSSLQAVDMRAPFPLDPTHNTAVTPILADPTHQRIILTFDENLEQVNQTAPGNFGVVINGDSWTVKSIGVSDNSAGMADNQVFLYFDSITNARGELFDWTNAGISVSYTDGTTDITSVIQDLAGNDVTSFNDFNSDTLAPNALITIDDTILSSGNIAKMTVSFSEAASSLDIGDFTVQNGFLENLATANGGKTWTADLKANANIDDTSNIITLGTSYTDAHGINGIAATSGNYAIDTKVPLFLNAVANNANDTIVLTFDDVLDAANHASGSDFYVTDGSTTTDPITGITTINQIDVLGVGISGTTMTLSMKPMDAGNWKVIYTDINGDTQYAIQDIYGSDTTGFSWTNAVI